MRELNESTSRWLKAHNMEASRYVFERKTLKSPFDYSGLLNETEIKALEEVWGKLDRVVITGKGTLTPEEYYQMIKEYKEEIKND